MNLNQLTQKNLTGRPGRTAALVVIVTLLAITMLGGLLVTSALQKGLDSLQTRLGADIIVVPDEAKTKTDLESILLDGVPGYFYMDKSNLDKIAALEGIGQISAQYYMASAKAGCCSMPVQIIGFDPATDFTVTPWIRKSGGQALGTGDVVIGCDVNKGVGDTVTFFGRDCRVSAKLDSTGTKLDSAVYANADTIKELIEGSKENSFAYFSEHDPDQIISSVLIRVQDGYAIEDVAGDINLHVRGVKAVSTRSMLSGVSDSIRGVSGVIRLLIIIIWILLLVILFVVFTAMIRARSKEFAILRVMGISRRQIVAMILKESLVVSLAGGLAGAIVSVAGVRLFSHLLEARLGLPFLAPSVGYVFAMIWLTLLAAAAIGCLASAYAASRLSRVDVGLILREGN